MEAKAYIDSLIEKSRIAQKEFENFTQEQVDAIVKEIAKVVYDNAEELAKMAVEETGMGVYEHKVLKNKGKSKTIWNSLKGKKSVGIINRDAETGIVEIAKPMGVVGSVTPTTNPIVTPMCNAMFALKGRNSIVIAPHPRAKQCSTYTVKLINEAIKKHNAPENLIQIIEEPSIEKTNLLMAAVDVVVATGGMGMVKAAYSSGKPAYGVGAGNVQVIIDRDVDFDDAAQKIIAGRTFDNGIICSGEQTVIAHEDDYDKVIEAFKKNGAYYVSDKEEKEKFRNAMFINGALNKDVVGQSPQKVAEIAGVEIPADTKVILIEADGIGVEDVLCKEKMCPVMATFRYKTFEEGVRIAQTNLSLEGAGHSAAIHSNNNEHIDYAGENLTVSRLVVNQPSSTTAGGSFFNGFAPTTTLGCGSWGNNSISENFTYKHMINISRIGHYMADRVAPTDEEIWA
ncbi:aldehyde dehydrogenase family protein [Crassaminicella thermophila]|uniref:Aldehyde dehydrogenase family protein n=1 Tax=Crassaminicella thermophila TaxID=2599308 RepID=A0A5C0SFB3_CRATE|nr:aldehyde dehydrogenase family protein [Crassaminicella thermophila]QEK13041.1 aldehyde dehydrogenase family protein [Crassaminicella thermophila]